MLADPPFPLGSWVVVRFTPGRRWKVLEVKPYQGVPCGWLSRLEGYAIPWVDMGTLTAATAFDKPPAPAHAPATPLGAPPPHPAPKAAKPTPPPPPPEPRLF